MSFEEVADRTDAESLRGIDLELAVDAEEEADVDPDAWYPSQLEGLAVRHVDGRELGVVAGVDHYPAQDLLVVRTPDRRRVAAGRRLVPGSTSPRAWAAIRPAGSSTRCRRTSRAPAGDLRPCADRR